MQLERSRDAEDDLDEILGYSIAQYGEPAAAEYFFSFDDAFALLRRHPYAGAEAEEIEPGVRRLTHRRHRIYYEIYEDRIFVLRILHHAMDARRHLTRS